MTQGMDGRSGAADAASRQVKRRGRIGLFLPYVLLAIVVLGWSGAWFWIRGRAEGEMDAWLAREAAAGRTWTCQDRSLTGFPFRLELRCAAVTLSRSDGSFRLGPATAVAQIYQPRLVLFESQGPFHVEQGGLTGDASWSALQGSFHGAAEGFTRASLVVDGPKVTVAGAEPQPISVAGRHLEIHARPSPARFESDGAVDVNLQLAEAAIPALDTLTGGNAPVDASLDATLDRATVLGTGALPKELEKWRRAGGLLQIAALSLAKGDQRIQARGQVALDEAHRPTGQIDLRAAGVDALIGNVVGQRFGSKEGALVGQLVGGLLGLGRGAPRAADQAQTPGASGPPLKPLPPLKLVDGQVLFSGFPIPNVRVPPLY
ncbi:DUF2125 domain-containing protein [Methylobacterium persicinum]|uniref:DUF2125 domain-containing protein n=1 Tax=Methylobacterium persicinum TaxID=374426 RepID=A0ABU0HHD0_9HYPH|nr:DUF2125 domain-containing protein [Methylobacterium persicinum]MDQ0440909.1 hypothetical protein [Methylobacterium persicinum]GJE39941.1 hypothetical protein KHHGKMAE_4030 [Methylobacterium persicinum]